MDQPHFDAPEEQTPITTEHGERRRMLLEIGKLRREVSTFLEWVRSELRVARRQRFALTVLVVVLVVVSIVRWTSAWVVSTH